MRYTRKDAESAFDRLRIALNKGRTEDYGIYDPKREGTWSLDYSSAYGGYVVAETIASSPPREGEDQGYTAETRPFGDERRTAREFCDVVWFALRVLHEREQMEGDRIGAIPKPKV